MKYLIWKGSELPGITGQDGYGTAKEKHFQSDILDEFMSKKLVKESVRIRYIQKEKENEKNLQNVFKAKNVDRGWAG